MAQIRDKGLGEQAHDVYRDRARADNQILDLIKSIQKDRARAVELSRVDIRQAAPDTQQHLALLIGQQLKGQIPAQLAKQLAAGNVATDVLDQLMQRLANSSSADPNVRLGRATTPEAARELATDRSVPQQALRWTQFVQKVLHVPGGTVQGRAGTATPKGETAKLLEMLGQKGGMVTAAGLRSPKLVERGLADLSPGQRALLMKATFGEKLAGELNRLGVQDPLGFVKAGALPEGRAELAGALNLSRAHLLGLLMRAELLKVGPGRNGELGINPELLAPLRHAGLVMLGTLGILRSLSREELAYIYGKLRTASGGFAKAVKGGRPPVKRDLIHWARAAGRKASDILLPDIEERGPKLSSGDAQELIQAWYMENLLYEQLAYARRQRQEEEHLIKKVSRDERDERRDRRGQGNGGDDDDPEWIDDMIPELEHDDGRQDHLVCFWITDFNTDPTLPQSMRRMYVCIDPDSGAIIPQAIEADLSSGRA
ncbi:MAG: hypothetical protein HY903_01160 [Deltaproteobacteria bacterium]|nr:hypothetical protein [Deltaproteobacteria bacterium]